MRILHDFEGVDCKDRSPSAKPDRTILSPPEHLVSSGKNILPLSSQNKTSNCGKVLSSRGEKCLGMVRVKGIYIFFCVSCHILFTLAYVISESILIIK